jgi:hypothetical protein
MPCHLPQVVRLDQGPQRPKVCHQGDQEQQRGKPIADYPISLMARTSNHLPSARICPLCAHLRARVG